MDVWLVAGSAGVHRPHFHTPLHPWTLTDTKPVVPHAHSGWSLSPFSKSLSHPSPTAPLTVHPGSLASSSSVATSSSHLFNFPPTPPKDSTPEISSGHVGAGGSGLGAPSASGSGSEYSPESKPTKSDVTSSIVDSSSYSSSLNCMSTSLSMSMGGSGGPAHHPMPTYPYMGPSDYASSALFHPANMFKAATLARCRTKSRSSSGQSKHKFYCNISSKTKVCIVCYVQNNCPINYVGVTYPYRPKTKVSL